MSVGKQITYINQSVIPEKYLQEVRELYKDCGITIDCYALQIWFLDESSPRFAEWLKDNTNIENSKFVALHINP